MVQESQGGGYKMTLSFVDLSGSRLTGCVPSKLQYVWSIRVDLPFCE